MILLAFIFFIDGLALTFLGVTLARNAGKARRYKTHREYMHARFGSRVATVIGAMFLTVGGAIINPHDFHVEAILLLIAATALSCAAMDEADDFGCFEGDSRIATAYIFMTIAVILHTSGGYALT